MNKLSYIVRCALLFTTMIAAIGTFAQAEEATKSQETALIEVLQSGTPAEKAIACKKLAIYGSKAAVPELAKLLSDEHLASWARIALEAIPDPACDGALRDATQTLTGRLLVGTINSLGVRRDSGAVDRLATCLKDTDAEVASAAAVALGRIGNATAITTLQGSLASAPAGVKSAVAEGCVLAAERLMADGKSGEAVALYDAVRQADVPKPRILEATRGAILARKVEGIPLLVEQLQSEDKQLFYIGLGVARELPGREVADALAAETAKTTPERAALLLYALADRPDFVVSPALLAVAKQGDKQIRIAALGVIGPAGNAESLPTLLEIAADEDQELSQAAKTAIASLPGDDVDQEVTTRLPQAEGKSLAVLIDVVGQRRIAATASLVKALDNSDATIRGAALKALGETVGPQELSVLIAQVVSPKTEGDANVAGQALKAACVRMPDRDACAAELAAAMQQAPLATKAKLVEILGAMGGPKALATIAMAFHSGDEQLQDTGSRMLGQWMTIDAGPVLLDMAKTASSDKYQVRALRGYLRIARQFTMSEAQRAEMCQNAFDASRRPEERQLVLQVLERYPNVDTLKVAVNATKVPELKADAGRVALAIAHKLGGKSADAQELIGKIGLEPLKVEIIKAEYGAGSAKKDVTTIVQKQVRDVPLIILPSSNYNESFGGDPAPNVKKELKIQYMIDGVEGDITFPENTLILLPVKK